MYDNIIIILISIQFYDENTVICLNHSTRTVQYFTIAANHWLIIEYTVEQHLITNTRVIP